MEENLYSGWWFPPNISANHGQTLDLMILIIIWVSVIGALGVIGVMLFAVMRYSNDPTRKSQYFLGNFKKQMSIGVALTIFVLGGEFYIMGYLSGNVWHKMRHQAPKNAIEIEVLAEQFSWNVRYPGEDGQFGKTDLALIDEENSFGIEENDPKGVDDIVTRGILHAPVNVPIKIKLRSKDMIHSFFIPELRIKQDALPGQTISVWFQAQKIGNFQLACAELCGLGHTTMKAQFIVESMEEFKAWLAEKSEEP